MARTTTTSQDGTTPIRLSHRSPARLCPSPAHLSLFASPPATSPANPTGAHGARADEADSQACPARASTRPSSPRRQRTQGARSFRATTRSGTAPRAARRLFHLPLHLRSPRSEHTARACRRIVGAMPGVRRHRQRRCGLAGTRNWGPLAVPYSPRGLAVAATRWSAPGACAEVIRRYGSGGEDAIVRGQDPR